MDNLTLKFQNIIEHIASIFSLNKSKFIDICKCILLFGIIVINSGYTLLYTSGVTTPRTITVLVSLIILSIIFVFTVDFKVIGQKFKSKKPTLCFIAICIFGFSTLLTMFASGEINELISYIVYGMQIVSAYLLAKLLNLKKFLSIFQKGMLIISLLSIFFFISQAISGISLSPLPTFTSTSGAVYYNYFFISFTNIGAPRMQGPFWEPGLFASFLLIALSFEVLFYKKIRWTYIITFFVAIILTQSTFGILLSVLIALFAINKKVESTWVSLILYLICFGTIISFVLFPNEIIGFLANLFPSVFKKMLRPDGSISFLDNSRLQSPVINLQLWLKSPIWGNGLIGTDAQFQGTSSLCQTSTTTLYLAQFGILGIAFTVFFILGIFKVKQLTIENKIILTILFLCIMNKEPHSGIIFEWFLMFLLIKEYWDHDHVALAFEKPSSNSIISSFSKNDDDSIIKRNITISFIIKGLALLLGFFSYPVYRSYFNDESVIGIWLAVLSLMSMVITFDLGLGNGLKNKLVKAIVDDDKEKQRQLISSTYFFTFAISLLLMAVMTPIIFTCDLNAFLNIDTSIINETTLRISVFLVLCSIFIEFSLKNVNSLLQAKQKQGLSSLFALLSTLLLIIFALSFKSDDKNTLLLAISFAYIFSINIPLIIGTFYVFKKDYPGCFPKWKYVSKDSAKDIVSLGLGFFVIQLLLLALNSTNELFISNFFGPAYVTTYTNYYKPFSVIASLFTIITLPYWAMTAKQKEENNFVQIKANFKKCFIYLGVFTFMCVFLSIIFQPFINLWLGKDAMQVDFFVVILFDIFMIEWMLVSAFTVIANGFSIIKKQIIIFAISAVLKITLCFVAKAVIPNLQWYSIIIVNLIAYVPLVIGLLLIVLKELRKENFSHDEI